MGFFHVAALAVLIVWIAYKEKETLVDVIPAAVCILVLVLYGLSFIRGLLLSDYLAVGVCLFAAIFLIRASKERRNDIAVFCLEEIKKPGSIIALVMMIAVPLLVSGKAVTWWDDYNFWATDVKSIFYLDGFAGKYENAAPEFGDYPPGTQMMKWWFLHFSPTEFKEGLLFAGYHFMNLVFLFPVLKNLKRKNFLLMLFTAAALWLFPTSVEVFGCDGCCADLTMAVIYGTFLAAVLDRQGHSRLFYYGRQALFLMVLVLCKNVGFLWTAFALLFAYGYHILMYKKEKTDKAARRYGRRGLFWITLLPVLTEASWLLFCLMNRRVAKLTGTALHMATGSMNIPDVQAEMIRAFITAFIRYPLHRWSTPAIDLSPLALYVLLLIFVFLLYKRGKLMKGQAWYIGAFFGISGICFYGINLISHLTIFAVETQYLEPFGMVSSIERYGAPFTVGGLYLTAYLITGAQAEEALRDAGKVRRLGGMTGFIMCLVFVFLTADYQSAYRGLIGYRNTAAEALKAREEIVDEQAENFLQAIGSGILQGRGRALYLRDISDVSWVRNTYIGYEAAPVSVMHGNVDAESMESADIIDAIEDAHADYLYVDTIEDGEELWEALTGGEAFEYGCLYRVWKTDGEVTLQKVHNRNSAAVYD